MADSMQINEIINIKSAADMFDEAPVHGCITTADVVITANLL